MKRRTLVHAAVAAPLAGFIHRQVFTEAEAGTSVPAGPLRTIYHEWQATRDAFNAHPGDDDPEARAILARHYAAEAAIVAARSNNLHDLAASKRPA